MNEAFNIIESQRRLIETTFAFGGNMVLHWKMFENVPFDPYISRGEDMDLLVNTKMLGFKFMLDAKLRVIHLPGETKSLWSEMRQDLYRFLYMRQKMLSWKDIRDIRRFSIDALKPYPGHFLGLDVVCKFAVSSYLNCLHSVLRENLKSFREFLRNICQIPPALRFAGEHCVDYLEFQKKWSSYMPKIRDDKSLRQILESSS